MPMAVAAVALCRGCRRLPSGTGHLMKRLLQHRASRRVSGGVVVIGILSTSLIGAPIAGANSSAAGGAHVPAICGIDDQYYVSEHSELSNDGIPAYLEWLASDAVQLDLLRMDEALRSELKSTETLGTVVDHPNQQVIVVVDQSHSSSIAERIAPVIDSLDLAFKTSLRASCAPVVDLLDAEAVVASKVEGIREEVAFSIDAARGLVAVVGDLASAETEKLESSSELVEVDNSIGVDGLTGGRLNDASTHYGDARIGTAVNGGSGCSSGPTFVSIFGVRVSSTAGHCGVSGTQFRSGSQIYGTSLDRTYSTAGDFQMIVATGQSYSRTFYTDPGSPATRAVIGKVTPVNGTLLCAGGSYSFADCGAEVYDVAGSLCKPNGGCNTVQWSRRGATQEWICQPGDSGGVMYQRSGTSSALAGGMIQGGHVDSTTNQPVPVFGYYTCAHQTISAIESATGGGYSLAVSG